MSVKAVEFPSKYHAVIEHFSNVNNKMLVSLLKEKIHI